MTQPPCDVCGKPSVIVANSACGAFSLAYCAECARAGREPWSAVVACCSRLERDHVTKWFLPVIEATCQFYGKTEDELWAEAALFWEEYEAACCP